MDTEIANRKSQPFWVLQHDQVDRQESPSSDITQCPSETRNPADILVGRDLREKRIIKDVSFCKADISKDEKGCAHPIITRMNEIKETGEKDAAKTKGHQKAFLRPDGVGHRT